jgi:mRNA-degrading endonuclease HigB of HigAB toxin-antitoxin module
MKNFLIKLIDMFSFNKRSNYKHEQTAEEALYSDWEALRGDWNKVGEDLRNVFNVKPNILNVLLELSFEIRKELLEYLEGHKELLNKKLKFNSVQVMNDSWNICLYDNKDLIDVINFLKHRV